MKDTLITFIGTVGIAVGVLVGIGLERWVIDKTITLPEKLCVNGLVQTLDETKNFYKPITIKCIAIEDIKKDIKK